jgi:glycosyltransferase involved in cell wall biosynthesis
MNSQDMHTRIEVSVIMACYNSSAYLDEAINSILSQTFHNFELIIVDDCSVDNTIKIANYYKSQDDRILVLPLPTNSGAASARNAGIQIAQGGWIAILDSDDIALPSRLKEQMELANSDPDLVLIGSNTILIDKHGNLIESYKYPTDHKNLSNRLYTMSAFPPHSSMVYKRDAFNILSGFNPRFPPSEDNDLCIRLSEVGKIGSVDLTLVKVRKHDQNISLAGNGEISFRLGLIGCMCHFLRTSGYPSPADTLDESSWEAFVSWVGDRVEEEKIFQKRKGWANATAKYYEAKNKMMGGWCFAKYLFQSGDVGGLIKERFIPLDLAKRLAREWMQ